MTKPEDAYKIWLNAYTNNYGGTGLMYRSILAEQAWYAAINYCEQETIIKLKAVVEAFASVASEEGVREMLLGYVQGARALEALEGLREY